jgi:hypothetical protein
VVRVFKINAVESLETFADAYLHDTLAQLGRWSADPQVAGRCVKGRQYLWANAC